MNTTQIWEASLKDLEAQFSARQLQTWILPMEVALDDARQCFVLTTDSQFKADWIRNQFLPLLQTAVKKYLPENYQLILETKRRAAPKIPLAQSGPAAAPVLLSENAPIYQNDLSALGNIAPEEAAQDGAIGEDDAEKAAAEQVLFTENSGFNIKKSQRFETFVEGSSNRVARSAGLHIAEKMDNQFNPFFIYGGSGVGKSHLLQAIGNQALENFPHLKVRFINAEQFLSEVVRSYQQKNFDAISRRYHQLDLLLIDDVQFVAGKERTQEELSKVYEALTNRNAQLIFASDTYPTKILNIHPRLTSRWASGLAVDIAPPEFEMRVAIVLSKALERKEVIEDAVAHLIARHVRGNVRDLEGALRKVLAYAKFNHKKVTLELAKKALEEIISTHKEQISIENIQKTVADFYKLKVSELLAKDRTAARVRPRQIAMYLVKEITQFSLPAIGEAFGGRDHTTVIHAVRKIEKERKNLDELNRDLNLLEQLIKG